MFLLRFYLVYQKIGMCFIESVFNIDHRYMQDKKSRINVAVCDDHQVVLEGLRLIMDSIDKFHLSGMFHTSESLISFLKNVDTLPDVIILDAHLGSNQNGLDVIRQVENPHRFRWILFSSYVDKYLAFQAEKAGFQACLSKEVPASVLISVLTEENRQRSFVCHPQIQHDEKTKRNMEAIILAKLSLTKREEEVMGVICSGINAKAGADKLHISIYTFETHKKNIFRKFDINSTNELMRIAMDFNLV